VEVVIEVPHTPRSYGYCTDEACKNVSLSMKMILPVCAKRSETSYFVRFRGGVKTLS